MNTFAVIIDFSHLFHLSRAAALHAGPAYDLTETTITNVVGKLRTVKKCLAEHQVVGYDLVFAEDRPALRKLALLPGYRAGRHDLSEEKNLVKQYLLQNGSITRFCYSEGNEADDVIATIVSLALAQDGLFVIVVTSDRDLWQLIGPRTGVFNPITREFVTEAHVQKSFKCRPIHIPLVKALWGDSGDCVPNVIPRMQKQLLPIILETDGDLLSFKTRLQDYKYFLTEKCYTAYLENESRVDLNWQLVKLDDQCPLIWE